VRLAVSASNLFGKDYVSNCLTVDLWFFGLRRTVLWTVSYRW
jgi:iron complex outermembrane recepter protein